MWKSEYGRITNGFLSLSFIAAYDYIVLYDKHKTMKDLGISEASYKEFRGLVCKKLTVPRYLCP